MNLRPWLHGPLVLVFAPLAGCYVRPAPVYVAPAPQPVYVAPAPAPAPVYAEPAPPPPAPVYVEPAPPPPPPEPAPVVVDEEAPDLVEVSPGVQVIYDYDEPVFFSDGFYWRQENGIWFSSRSYRGGWGRYEGVPVRFRTLNTRAYVHYRP